MIQGVGLLRLGLGLADNYQEMDERDTTPRKKGVVKRASYG